MTLYAIYALAPDPHGLRQRRDPHFVVALTDREDAVRVADVFKRVTGSPMWVSRIQPEEPAHVTMQQRVLVEGRV